MTEEIKGRTKEVLERLKGQERRPLAKPFISPIRQERPKEAVEKKEEVVSLPLMKVEKIMRNMEDLDRKMKKGDSYLNYYGDMKIIENEFLNAVSDLERFGTEVPGTFKKRIDFIKERIERKKGIE